MDQRPVKESGAIHETQEVNAPDEERPRSRGEIGFFPGVVDARGRSYRVEVRPQEQEIHDDIDDLQDVRFPLSVRARRHTFRKIPSVQESAIVVVRRMGWEEAQGASHWGICTETA